MFGLKKKDNSTAEKSLFDRLCRGLQKTRSGLFAGLDVLFRSSNKIDISLLEDIETRLLMADLGVESTTNIINSLNGALKRNELNNMDQLMASLRKHMLEQLLPLQQAMEFSSTAPKPFVILVVGVNGAGKTTTIGKLTHRYLKQGHKVILAAGDTFRAAAIEQIKVWGAKTNVPVIAQQSGSDAAAVIYDALQSARARGADIVIADTAGRLHNQSHLMQELKKIRRTISKFDPDLAVEVLLVIDAGTGQNALMQARQFDELIGLSGIALTKLDGTAKGGIVFALANALDIPIRFIGIGEQLDDLRPFNAEAFIDALLDSET
ncbi:MAG: signal recognition particle-docking protein FtsY [Gammaproteobacteria bacterium]|nr:signal recognition particle-docking protein FtsY [Gammaproteobacteria bacterium]